MSETVRREDLSAARRPAAQASLARARDGDLKAFEELVHLVSPPVLHRVGWLLRLDPDQSSGVLQDAWLLAWQQIESFESAEHLAAWMHRVARCGAISILRRRRLVTTTWGDQARERPLGPEPESRGTDELDAETVDYIRAAIARLPDHYRGVATLYYIHGQSIGQIVILLQSKVATVRMRLYRARRWLRRSFRNRAHL